MQDISFFAEDVDFNINNPQTIEKWIQDTIEKYQKSAEHINIIFCSDAFLLKINQEYLNHDFFTDVITFDYSEDNNNISGDIFISTERVNENADFFNVNFNDEICRIIIHGILHLLGWHDDTSSKKALMHKEEEKALKQLKHLKPE